MNLSNLFDSLGAYRWRSRHTSLNRPQEPKPDSSSLSGHPDPTATAQPMSVGGGLRQNDVDGPLSQPLSPIGSFSDAITRNNTFKKEEDADQIRNPNLRLTPQYVHSGRCACFACSYSRDLLESDRESIGDLNTTISSIAPTIGYGTLNELSDYLTTGFWEEAGIVTRRYNLGSSGLGAKNGQLTYNITGWTDDSNGLSAERQALTREVFKVYEAITGISFVEVSTEGDFRFTDNDSGAYAYLAGGWYDQNPTTGDIDYSSVLTDYSVINVASSWFYGDSSYNGYTPQTIFHEIGHALGLGHQGQYNAGNGNPTYKNSAQYGNDAWMTTMMSYWSQTTNTNVIGSFAYLQTPMTVDWIALDKLYGSQGYGSFNAFTGDTIYGVGTNISSDSSEIMNDFAAMIGQTAYTLIDGSGYDILNVSNYADDQFINLAPSEINSTLPSSSSIGGLVNNLTIGVGTVLEEAIGGSGNDTFIGNIADNIFRGGGGEDSFYDSLGSDFYYGGIGDFDTVYFTDSYSDFSIENLGTYLAFSRNDSGLADTDMVWDDIELVYFNNDVVKTYQELIADTMPSNTPPSASDVFITTSEDSNSITGNFNASDPDSSDQLTYTITTAPSIGSIVINADDSFTYNFGNNFQTLNDNETADVVFEYIASDDNAANSTPATVTITIKGSNDAANISTESVVLTETNDALTAKGTLTSTDIDNNDNAFTSASTTGTYGTFSIDATGNWQFTANSAFDSLKQGESITESFNVVSIDGTQSSIQIRINGSNDAPILNGTPVVLPNGTEDVAYLLNASDLLQGYSDADGDTLSITSVSTASINGGISDNGNGTWTYTPTQDLNGEVVFSFVVSDGYGGAAKSRTTLTLDPVDDEVLLIEGNNDIPKPEPTPQPEPLPEPEPTPQPDPTLQPESQLENLVQRLYNSSQGRYLFSSNQYEIDLLTGGAWQDEGVIYNAPETATADVFRFYIPSEGRHFYTALESERDFIIGNQETFSGWQYEGAAFSAYSTSDYPDDAVAVVRYLNRETGSHVYSTSAYEQSLLDQNSNWMNEGIAWFGDPMVVA